MGRHKFFMTEAHALFEVSVKTIQARFLLMPGDRLNEILLGVLGRAQSFCPEVRVYLFVAMSNHLHMILSAPKNEDIPRFMGYLNCNLSKEIGRLYDWPGSIWQGRYKKFEIMDHEMLMRRVHYILSHGCKEGMVSRPGDWPGVNCVAALTRGEPITGVWVDRTAMSNGPKTDEKGKPISYEVKYEVKLSALPGFNELSVAEQREEWRRIVRGIEEEYEKNPVKSPLKLARHPHHRPKVTKKGIQPLCLASTREGRKEYRESYQRFDEEYCDARDRLLAGQLEAIRDFPPGCFVPPFARVLLKSG